MRARICILIGLIAMMGACSPNPAKVDNKEGVVTSVGPVQETADGDWEIYLSVFDFEGDPVDVTAEIRQHDGAWSTLEHCANADAPCLKQPLRALSTYEDGRDKQHIVRIDPGSLNISAATLQFYALDDQNDAVIWPKP